jgi:hypothetical protein
MRTHGGAARIGRRHKQWGMLLPLFAALVFASIFSLSFRDAQSSTPFAVAEYERATPDVSMLAESSAVAPRRDALLESMGVSAWHARGWRGNGLKIAVLDSGFQGYRDHLGKALPKTVAVRSFRFDGNLEAKDSQHGILCAEVIHALAPEAELLLANWEPEHPQQFLAAAAWARRQGACILSCSLIMPTWSDCEGHGRVHEELARLLGSSAGGPDALFFASAGNTAQRHWSGSFEEEGDGYHVWKWDEGVACQDNVIRPWGRERVSVELCCPLSSVYELLISDTKTGKNVGRTTAKPGGGTNSAVVGFVPETGHDYRARVRAVSGAKETFHLVVLGGALRYSSAAGSIPFPGDGSEVIAVGAVDASGRRLAYSSCGLKSGATKPDFVATVPFPSCWRARPFAGTSAAAPQASGLAALLWSRHRAWNAGQIRTALQDAARPCPANRLPWETGRGCLRLPLLEDSSH